MRKGDTAHPQTAQEKHTPRAVGVAPPWRRRPIACRRQKGEIHKVSRGLGDSGISKSRRFQLAAWCCVRVGRAHFAEPTVSHVIQPLLQSARASTSARRCPSQHSYMHRVPLGLVASPALRPAMRLERRLGVRVRSWEASTCTNRRRDHTLNACTRARNPKENG